MAVVVEGLGPDAPIVANERGAKQSYSPYRFDLMDPRAQFALAKVLGEGAQKYGVDNWRGIPTCDHLNHALQHITGYLAGDTSDDHLAHGYCRMMMAVATALQEGAGT